MSLMVKIAGNWVTGITDYDESKWSHRSLRKAWEREGYKTRVEGLQEQLNAIRKAVRVRYSECAAFEARVIYRSPLTVLMHRILGTQEAR